MQDHSRTIIWLEEVEELMLELSPQPQTTTTTAQEESKECNNHNDDKFQTALNNFWVRSPLGFVKKREVSTQECLGREWVRGSLGYKLYTRKE